MNVSTDKHHQQACTRHRRHETPHQQENAAEISATAFEKRCISSFACNSWGDKYIAQSCQLTWSDTRSDSGEWWRCGCGYINACDGPAVNQPIHQLLLSVHLVSNQM